MKQRLRKSMNNSDKMAVCIITQLELVIHIISKRHPNLRSQTDIQMMSEALQKCAFVAKLNQLGEVNALPEYCKHLKYEHYECNTQIYTAGEQGEDFYVLLKGCLNVDKEFFGQEALLGEPIMETIICRTECIFGTLSKQVYTKILDSGKFNDDSPTVQFFRSTQLFGNFSRRTIHQLIPHFKLQYYDKYQVVYKENDTADFIYVVMNGEFQMQKKFYCNGKFKRVPISVIGRSQVFGESECLQNQPRLLSVVCLVAGNCYKLSIEDFQKKANESNHLSDMEQYINSYIRTQTLSRNDRIEKVSQTLEDNCNFLMGVNNNCSKSTINVDDFTTVELISRQRTHSRYAQVYSQQDRQFVKVRYATVHRNAVAIQRCASKTEQSSRMLNISLKRTPIKLRQQNLYDEIEIPANIKRKYQKELESLQKQKTLLGRQKYKILTVNNQSSIIAFN